MRELSEARFKRLLPGFNGSIGFAVFNVHESDKRRARKRIIAEFGVDGWNNGVKPYMTTGIMEIFHHKKTRILGRFAWYCALSVEKRLAREKEKSK